MHDGTGIASSSCRPPRGVHWRCAGCAGRAQAHGWQWLLPHCMGCPTTGGQRARWHASNWWLLLIKCMLLQPAQRSAAAAQRRAAQHSTAQHSTAQQQSTSIRWNRPCCIRLELGHHNAAFLQPGYRHGALASPRCRQKAAPRTPRRYQAGNGAISPACMQ